MLAWDWPTNYVICIYGSSGGHAFLLKIRLCQVLALQIIYYFIQFGRFHLQTFIIYRTIPFSEFYSTKSYREIKSKVCTYIFSKVFTRTSSSSPNETRFLHLTPSFSLLLVSSDLVFNMVFRSAVSLGSLLNRT